MTLVAGDEVVGAGGVGALSRMRPPRLKPLPFLIVDAGLKASSSTKNRI